MRKFLPGVKGAHIVGLYELSPLLPDPSRAALRDTQQRNLYLQTYLWSTHSTLAVNDTESAEGDGHPERIRSVQVGEVTGGTVTVQVQVEGADVFLDDERPVSGGEPEEASAPWIFTAGTPVATIIEATTGTPTGDASVVIETEMYLLLSKFVPIKLKGRDRLHTSRRKYAAALNAAALPPGSQHAARVYGYTASGTEGVLPSPGDTRPNIGPQHVYTTARAKPPVIPIIKPPPK